MGMAAGRSRPTAASSSERGRRWSARLTARSRVGNIRAAPAERCGRGDGDPGARERLQPHGMEIPSMTEVGGDLIILRVE
uniref:Uncharacterized protein n=1 Tax=Oryza barthii TaxID=65489 RepID=A0A0D3HHC1_9ORYZ